MKDLLGYPMPAASVQSLQRPNCQHWWWLAAVLAAMLSAAGCVRLPAGVQPIDQFQLDRYLGSWYEIARLDHPFERGLSRVTAAYSLRPDGSVQVVNRGFDDTSGRWKQVTGRAFFVTSPDQGYLQVSFFGPFYGSYVVIELDRDFYQYALVCGPSTDYLWILARSPTLDPEIQQRLIDRATALGFPTRELIFPRQKE